MDWKGFGKKEPWPNGINILLFAWRAEEKKERPQSG
jgi:hypothetical protein